MKTFWIFGGFILLLPTTTIGQVTVGAQVLASSGLSYRNPSLGGFVDVRANVNRLFLRGTGNISNDQKVFEQDGYTMRARGEVGVFVAPGLVVNGIVSANKHSNSSYTKLGVASGLGVRYIGRSGTQVYGSYMFPDTSPNRGRTLSVGIERFTAKSLYWGTTFSFDKFYQLNESKPRQGLIAEWRVGYSFGRRE